MKRGPPGGRPVAPCRRNSRAVAASGAAIKWTWFGLGQQAPTATPQRPHHSAIRSRSARQSSGVKKVRGRQLPRCVT